MKAADILSKDFGVEAEVIDARSVTPFRYDRVLESVKKTGRIVLVSDACARGSFANDMAAHIGALAFDDLDAPVIVLGAKNSLAPDPDLRDAWFPGARLIIDAIHEKILPLPDYVPVNHVTREDELRLERLGR